MLNDISFLQLSSITGLLATCFLTLNVVLGAMISSAYVKQAYWKKLPPSVRQLDVLMLHNWTAYIALLLVALHIVMLLCYPDTKFTLIDVFFPVAAPQERILVSLGTISLYALLTVVITTQKVIKKGLSFRTWKNIHLISYCTAMLFIVHGILIDPKLKDQPVDFVDAEKFIPEGCLIVLIMVVIFRFRFYLLRQKTKISVRRSS